MTALQARRGRPPRPGRRAGRGRRKATWPGSTSADLGLLLMVGPFLWMLLGSFKPQAEFLAQPADLPARGPDDRQLRAALRPARLPALLLQLGGRRARR